MKKLLLILLVAVTAVVSHAQITAAPEPSTNTVFFLSGSSVAVTNTVSVVFGTNSSPAITFAINQVLSDPVIEDDFWQGIQFGFVVVVFVFTLSMLRSITGDDREDL